MAANRMTSVSICVPSADALSCTIATGSLPPRTHSVSNPIKGRKSRRAKARCQSRRCACARAGSDRTVIVCSGRTRRRRRRTNRSAEATPSTAAARSVRDTIHAGRGRPHAVKGRSHRATRKSGGLGSMNGGLVAAALSSVLHHINPVELVKWDRFDILIKRAYALHVGAGGVR